MGWVGGAGFFVELAISSDGIFFKNIYVIDIPHILTFQTSGDSWPTAFYLVSVLIH